MLCKCSGNVLIGLDIYTIVDSYLMILTQSAKKYKATCDKNVEKQKKRKKEVLE